VWDSVRDAVPDDGKMDSSKTGPVFSLAQTSRGGVRNARREVSYWIPGCETRQGKWGGPAEEQQVKDGRASADRHDYVRRGGLAVRGRGEGPWFEGWLQSSEHGSDGLGHYERYAGAYH